MLKTIVQAILFKFFLRSLLASIFPIILYSIGFGIFKLVAPKNDFTYGNPYAWIALGVICLVWPFQNIGLGIFFGLIEGRVKYKLRKNSPTVGSTRGEAKGSDGNTKMGKVSPTMD